jgi:Tol biopolymer transport system component
MNFSVIVSRLLSGSNQTAVISQVLSVQRTREPHPVEQCNHSMNTRKHPSLWLLLNTLLMALASCSGPALAPSIAPPTETVPTPESASTSFPDGQPQIVFHSDPNGASDLYLMNMDGSGLVRLTENFNTGPFSVVSSDGRWLAFSDRGNQDLFLLDLKAAGQGEAVQPVNLTESTQSEAEPDWSPDGRKLAYVSYDTGHIYWLELNDAMEEPAIFDTGALGFQPTWSADGLRLTFFSDRDGNAEIYVMESDGSSQTRLTDDPAPDYSPRWSPDGQRLLFISERDGNAEVYVMNADGSGLLNLSTDPAHDEFAFWSPDGARIVYVSYQEGTDPQSIGEGDAEIFIVNADGSGKLNLTENDVWDGDPAWSPDSQWIAFTQRVGEQHQGHIQVIRADGSGETRLVGEPGEWNDCCSVWRP